MVLLGVVAGVIVAAGTVMAGAISIVNWISNRARRAEQEKEYKAKVAADLEELKKRLSEQ